MVRAFAVFCIAAASAFAHAEVLELEGTVKAVDPDARWITIVRRTPKGEKILDLEVAKNAGDMSSLKEGDAVAFAYNPDVEIVSKIEKQETPSEPTGVTGTAGDGQVVLTWTAPSSDGGAAIKNYVIEYSSDDSRSWSSRSIRTTGTSGTITGLFNGDPYIFRVGAVNSAGMGHYDYSSQITPRGTPSAPEWVTGTAGNQQVNLTWQTPYSNGGAITDYMIEFSSNFGKTWVTYDDGVTAITSATVNGLTNGVTYKFRVSALNAVGAGDPSRASSRLTPVDGPIK